MRRRILSAAWNLAAPLRRTRPSAGLALAVTLALITTPMFGSMTGGTGALSAQERSLLIERFDAVVSVLPSSDILVEETIRVRFNGSWNGLYRTIPVEYTRPQGFA